MTMEKISLTSTLEIIKSTLASNYGIREIDDKELVQILDDLCLADQELRYGVNTIVELEDF